MLNCNQCCAPILAIVFFAAAPAAEPCPVGHRGLIHDAPENTLAAFAACLELRLGFELDVRRTRDGHLVCLHDETVDRTTDGRGRVADLTLAELKKLDAGTRFHPAFKGEQVPTLDEAFSLLDRHQATVWVAVDIKIDDLVAEIEIVRWAKIRRVLDRLVFIGNAINDPTVRRRLRSFDKSAHVAVLAQTSADLPKANADVDSDWVYARFVPTPEETAGIRRAGKKLFLVGPPVMGKEPANWRRAKDIQADAILTDYPLECRRAWQSDE